MRAHDASHRDIVVSNSAPPWRWTWVMPRKFGTSAFAFSPQLGPVD